MLKVALNGHRAKTENPALPITVEDLMRDAVECVAAGAAAIHVHPRDGDGRETLEPEVIDSTVRALRAAAAVPVGVSTGAWIEPDPDRRAKLVARWREPDMASVNLSEEGAGAVIRAILAAEIEVEVGIWSLDDVERLAASGLGDRVSRILVEIVRPVADATAEARRIDSALDVLGFSAPRLHHGEGDASWPVLRQAVDLGRDVRIGLEDTLSMPDGRPAASNVELVRSAAMLRG